MRGTVLMRNEFEQRGFFMRAWFRLPPLKAILRFGCRNLDAQDSSSAVLFVEFRTFGGLLTNVHLFCTRPALFGNSPGFCYTWADFSPLKQKPFPENLNGSTDVDTYSSGDPGLFLELLGVTVIQGVMW